MNEMRVLKRSVRAPFLRCGLLLAWLVFLAMPVNAQWVPELDPIAPPLIAQTCFACHGPGGESVAPAIPSLAGLPRRYLVEVMQAYRYGGRFSTLMGRIMSAYDDVQIERLADYFSRQPEPMMRQDVDWNLLGLGRQLHRRYCFECHGDPVNAPKPGVPRLHGRWMDYLRWTLRDYLVGINQGDDEMSGALARLVRTQGEEGLEALLHYYGRGKP
ncbi:MAG: c-type cytochrome [Candidatus Thiodiazotropha sp.]